MPKTLENGNFMAVDLAEGIMLKTLIAEDNLPALRSGFAGYPANPRWNAVKIQAWKTGRQLREALACGEMVVRPADSMLIPASDREGAREKQAIAPQFKPQMGSQLVLVS